MPRLFWDWGTAYDLFVSIQVLHNPATYRIRGAWAAGVRARLPAAEREMLEQGQLLLPVPSSWIYALPHPKDAAAALWTLDQIPPAQRLPALSSCSGCLAARDVAVLQGIAARGTWDEKDRDWLRTIDWGKDDQTPLSLDEQTLVLGWWARAGEFGERYLEALRAYHQVFFAEEEKRIRPALQKAVARAQELAQTLAVPELLEELSQGLRFDALECNELVLAPSYWSAPLMFFGQISAERKIFLFGARPPDASLIPGEAVPDTLLRSLQALADPTRLRILRYLAEQPLTPTELGRRLRLRTPTVTHHLAALRLAGLVQLTLGEGGETKHYAARPEAAAAAFAALEGFLSRRET